MSYVSVPHPPHRRAPPAPGQTGEEPVDVCGRRRQPVQRVVGREDHRRGWAPMLVRLFVRRPVAFIGLLPALKPGGEGIIA